MPSACPEATARSAAFDVAVVRAPGNELRGRLVSSDSGKPIARAIVDYPTIAEPGAVTTTAGQFTLRADSLGVYTLRARQIGYAPALGRVHVRADSGGPLQIVMQQSTIIFDECGYAQLREERPWWQWWFPP